MEGIFRVKFSEPFAVNYSTYNILYFMPPVNIMSVLECTVSCVLLECIYFCDLWAFLPLELCTIYIYIYIIYYYIH